MSVPAMTDRVLVTGANGQLGSALRASLAAWQPTNADVTFVTRDDVDLADTAALRTYIEALGPRLVVNAAAYTAVDRAESDAAVAAAVNADAPRVMAAHAARIGGAVVHVSTDYVFDGSAQRPYHEAAPTNPLNVYGRTKLDGEDALRASGAAHWILRTSWVYSAAGANFLKTMLRLAESKETISVVADQQGAPTDAKRLARFIAAMLHGDDGAPDARRGPRASTVDEMIARVKATSGTYHASASGATTWHRYAQHVVRGARDRTPDRTWPLSPDAIRETFTADYPTPAKRPLFSLLDHGQFIATFGIVPPPWQLDVDACLDELFVPSER